MKLQSLSSGLSKNSKKSTIKHKLSEEFQAANFEFQLPLQASMLYPIFYQDLWKKNTGIDLVLDVTNKSQVDESLKNNEIDFALVSVIPDKVNIEEELLIRQKSGYTYKIFIKSESLGTFV